MDRNSKIIIGILVVIIIIIGCVMVYIAFSGSEEDLREENFGKITMNVPEDANFQNYSVQASTDVAGYRDSVNNIQLYYVPSIIEDVMLQATQGMLTSVDSSEYNNIEVENQTALNNMRVFEYNDVEGLYYVMYTVDGFTIELVGYDLELLVKMMSTVKVIGEPSITNNTTVNVSTYDYSDFELNISDLINESDLYYEYPENSYDESYGDESQGGSSPDENQGHHQQQISSSAD